MTDIVIPASVTEIGEKAFSRCSALETITFLGAGIKKIDKTAFIKTPLKSIQVPAKKTAYYKKRLPEKLHGLIVELPA